MAVDADAIFLHSVKETPEFPDTYQGCFWDSNARDMEFLAHFDDMLTNEQCRMACQVEGYKYAGTQVGGTPSSRNNARKT